MEGRWLPGVMYDGRVKAKKYQSGLGNLIIFRCLRIQQYLLLKWDSIYFGLVWIERIHYFQYKNNVTGNLWILEKAVISLLDGNVLLTVFTSNIFIAA